MNRKSILLAVILIIGIWLRINSLNWDSNFHLHPDERFLTMVGNAMKMPPNLSVYLDPNSSFLNPANINFKFYVYGTFPIVLNKIIAVLGATDTYNAFTIQGRLLSALFDAAVIIVVYKIASLLFGKKSFLSLLSAFFYAIAALPIQLSHYFAVDTFLTFFTTGSFYFAMAYYFSEKQKEGSKPETLRKFGLLGLSAIFFGLAVACKVSAVYVLPLILVCIALTLFQTKSNRSPAERLYKVAGISVVFSIISYFTLRLADPYYFASANFLNIRLSPLFLANLRSLKSFEGIDIWFPPAVQWMSKPPIIFSLTNLAVFGLGVLYFVFFILGCLFFVLSIFKKSKNSKLCIDQVVLGCIGVFILIYFFYQSTQFVKAMRYLIFIYPFIALFAAIGFSKLREFVRNRILRHVVFVVSIAALLIWPLMISSIYICENSRVAASRYIFQTIPASSLILSEHWDDGLPLPLPDQQKSYRSGQLPVFDPDTPEKWETINALMAKGDYYILSSNRAWGSVPTVPQKYPLGSKFYEDLFKNRLPYKFVKEFHSYPSLRWLGIPIDFPDQWAEEAFTVYDHPQVYIFKNSAK